MEVSIFICFFFVVTMLTFPPILAQDNTSNYECPSPGHISVGKVIVLEDGSREYKCNDGYEIFGPAVIHCNENTTTNISSDGDAQHLQWTTCERPCSCNFQVFIAIVYTCNISVLATLGLLDMFKFYRAYREHKQKKTLNKLIQRENCLPADVARESLQQQQQLPGERLLHGDVNYEDENPYAEIAALNEGESLRESDYVDMRNNGIALQDRPKTAGYLEIVQG